MISVVDKEIIRRLYFKQQKSIRWIARELKMSRKTVRKALVDGDEPKYNLTRPKPKPVTGYIRPIIMQWLQEEKQFPAKQHYTARGIFNRLVAEYGYQSSESSVRRVVAELRQAAKETYIPLAFQPGTNAQCDWGSGYVYLDGEYTEVQLFCMRMTSSRKPFVMAFPNQKQEAFFAGHVQAFINFRGVPATITYDNLKAAVLKVLQGRSRHEQSQFIALRSHYLFESIYCTPGRANQKGQAENLVGYVKRNFLTPIPRVKTLDELNELLLAGCSKYAANHKVPGTDLTVEQAWAKEKELLLPLPARPFDCFSYAEVKANKSQLIRFDNNYYSVPDMWAGRNLSVKAYVDRVEIYGQRQLVATHPRCHKKGEEIYDLDHYLDTLTKKPGALEHAKPFQKANLPATYQQYRQELKRRHPRPQREFVHMLLLHRTVGWDTLTRALGEAYSKETYHLEGVRNITEKLSGKHIITTPLREGKYPHLETYKVLKPKLSRFNQLLDLPPGGVVH